MSIISMVVAYGVGNRAIGKDGDLPWKTIRKFMKPDMDRFVAITSGHPVVMGRKTWESIPKKFRPLVERTNIIVTRQKDYAPTGTLDAPMYVVTSFDEAFALAKDSPGGDEIMVAGGGDIYNELLPRAKRLYVTRVWGSWEGDTFFPPYENEFTVRTEDRSILRAEGEGPQLDFLTLERP